MWTSNIRDEISFELSNVSEQMVGENAKVPNINGSDRVCFILSCETSSPT